MDAGSFLMWIFFPLKYQTLTMTYEANQCWYWLFWDTQTHLVYLITQGVFLLPGERWQMKQVGNGIYLEIFLPPEGAEHDCFSQKNVMVCWCAGYCCLCIIIYQSTEIMSLAKMLGLSKLTKHSNVHKKSETHNVYIWILPINTHTMARNAYQSD